MKIKGIIFDYDGVIGDSMLQIFRVHKSMLRMFNKSSDLTLEQFRRMASTDWKKLYRDWGFTEEELAELPPAFLNEFMKLKNEIRLFDGIEDVIKSVHKKFRLAIASNGNSKRIREHLEQNNLLHCFELVIGLEAERLKPDPYQLLVCMRELGLQPEETCFVADTLVDITAGRRAGVGKIIAAAYGYQPAHFLTEADILVRSPQELLRALEGLG